MQTFDVGSGVAHVFYPDLSDELATASLLMEVDPVGLVRSARGPAGEGFSLGQYVNDRPYVAGSLLAVAIGKVFGSALHGKCAARPELVETAIPLRLRLPVLPCRGGVDIAVRLFAPLGWSVDAEIVPLDPAFPEWGDSRYLDVTLTGTVRLADALGQLYVLLPVLDDSKHYWVAADEVDKLIRVGGGWLAKHPERELITTRYLAHKRRFADEALERLAELDGQEADDTAELDAVEERVPSLAEQRRAAIHDELRTANAARVVDFGCGEGRLLRHLVTDKAFTELVGVDVAAHALRVAQRWVDRLPDRRRDRVRLLRGSVTYADTRIAGYDAIVLSEVVEHLDPPRLPALAAAVFGAARPGHVLMTTPNVEYNVRWESLPAGTVRHHDHRFEWTRAEFAAWAEGVCEKHGYSVRHVPVGPVDPEVGAPTQLAVFRRND